MFEKFSKLRVKIGKMKMAVKVNNKSGTGQQNLTRSLEKILEEAHYSGELSLSNRKLKDFPKPTKEYNLSDTIIAGERRRFAFLFFGCGRTSSNSFICIHVSPFCSLSMATIL